MSQRCFDLILIQKYKILNWTRCLLPGILPSNTKHVWANQMLHCVKSTSTRYKEQNWKYEPGARKYKACVRRPTNQMLHTPIEAIKRNIWKRKVRFYEDGPDPIMASAHRLEIGSGIFLRSWTFSSLPQINAKYEKDPNYRFINITRF